MDSSEWLEYKDVGQVSRGKVRMGRKCQITKAQCAGLSNEQVLKNFKKRSDMVRFAS